MPMEEERKEYWEEHSKDGSMQEMMLDNDAESLHKVEQPEILSYLPDYTGKVVVDLGAGIGRYTTVFAEKVSKVIAVDLMETFIQKNKEATAKFENVQHIVADVTKLKLEDQSTDLVFSNWLLMYLDDKEVQGLMVEVLRWLKEGGYLFERESCNHQSGNKERSFNPTEYREPALYEAFFRSAVLPTDDPEEVYGFDLVLQRQLMSYYKMKQNSNQIVWLLQKVRRKKQSDHGYATLQEFLDKQQYSTNGILRYEKIFGHNFVSTGGADTTIEFVKMLDLKKDQRVLDVGCGIGGSAFHMVKEFDVTVTAIDLSSNMIKIGMERAEQLGITPLQVDFEVADATKRDYPEAAFDIIYSRDTILHIADKLALFKKFLKYLRPGGKVLISDYCCSEGPHSDEFNAYVKQRGYNLITIDSYCGVLREAGFVVIRNVDETELFVQCLGKEVSNIEKIKEEFVQEFSQEDYDRTIKGWRDKIARSGKKGDQRWGLFIAENLTTI